MNDRFELPAEIRALVQARNALRMRYRDSGLNFTFDGNLVGDLGEALARELYGLDLEADSSEGIDGFAPDGRSVQVKASGTRRGPAFRPTEITADHLLFFHFDYEKCEAELIYDGPEHLVRRLLPETWANQRLAPLGRLRQLNAALSQADRLPLA